MSTVTWTDEEVGAYQRLLDYQRDHGSIPSDPKRRNRIADSLKSSWPTLKDKFKKGQDGELRNVFLEKLREEAKEKSRKARESAMERWARDGNATADANASPTAGANANADAMLSKIPTPRSDTPRPNIQKPIPGPAAQAKKKTNKKANGKDEAQTLRFLAYSYLDREMPEKAKEARETEVLETTSPAMLQKAFHKLTGREYFGTVVEL